MKYSTDMPSIFIFVFMKMFLPALIKDEHTSNDSLQSDSSFPLRNSIMTKLPAARSLQFSFFSCSLHRKFALFCTIFYLCYDIEILSDYVLLLDVTILA